MALFMDTHTIGRPVTIDDVAQAHAADLQAQDAHGVHYDLPGRRGGAALLQPDDVVD